MREGDQSYEDIRIVLARIETKVNLIPWLLRLDAKLDRLLTDRVDQRRVAQASDELDLSTMLRATAGDTDKVNALADELDARRAALAQAVVDNTPTAPAT